MMYELYENIEQAINYFETGKFNEGIEKLHDLYLNSSPEEKFLIIRLYIELGLIENAKELIENLSFETDSLEIERLKAELSYKEGNLEKAIELMNVVIEIEPIVDDYAFMSRIYFDQVLPEVSYNYIQKALLLNTQDPYLYYLKGTYLFELGDIDQSIESFEKAIKLDKDEPLYYLSLGKAYFNYGQFEEALDFLSEALRMDPNLEEAIYLYGILLVQTGDAEEGIKYIEKIVEIEPENEDVLITLADAYERNKNDRKAIEILEKIISLNEYNYQVLKRLADIYYHHGDSIIAKDYLEKALEIEPDDITLQSLKEKLIDQ